MANDENTAVNDLIARAQGGPAASSGGTGSPMFTTAPAKMPVAAPFEAPQAPPMQAPPMQAPPMQAPPMQAPPMQAPPMQAPPMQAPRAPIVPPPLDPNMPGGPGSGPTRMPPPFGPPPASYPPPGAPAVTGPPWAATTVPLNAPRERSRGGEHLVGTMRLTRRSDRQVMFSKLVIPMALLIVVGMLAGGYVAMHGETRARPTARPTPVAAAAAIAPVPTAAAASVPVPVAAAIAPVPPAPAATVTAPTAPTPTPTATAPAPTVTPASNLVDVRIDSTPTGATVTLVDRGKTQLVGNTPISTQLDASREYDLVFSYPNKPTKVEHVNLTSTRRVSVSLR